MIVPADAESAVVICCVAVPAFTATLFSFMGKFTRRAPRQRDIPIPHTPSGLPFARPPGQARRRLARSPLPLTCRQRHPDFGNSGVVSPISGWINRPAVCPIPTVMSNIRLAG